MAAAAISNLTLPASMLRCSFWFYVWRVATLQKRPDTLGVACG